MAGALIVIEISAPRVSDDALAVLVSSCTRAARAAQCVLAKNATGESPAAVAIVSLQSEDKTRVEVGVRQGDHDSWRTKDFAFLAADEMMDRWRAVGFAIGTLAESNAAPAAAPVAAPVAATIAPPPPPPPPPLPAAPSPQRVPPKPAPGARVFVTAVGVLGLGLDGPLRIGSKLGVALAPPTSPFYFSLDGSAATRIARGQQGATMRWFDVSAGPGISLLGSLNHSGLQLGAALVAESFDASASTIDGSSDSDARWLFGVEAAFGGRVEVAPDLFLVADFSAADLSGATEVKVLGRLDDTVPSFRYLASFGLRVRLR